MSESSQLSTNEGGFNFRLILGGVAAVALGLFVFQNTHDAKVNFLWMSSTMPLFFLILITTVLTLFIAAIVFWYLRRRD